MKQFDSYLLQKWTSGTWTSQPKHVINNFCFDTRKLNKNECFLAIKNQNNDGHRYVQTAENLCATAAIVEHPISNCKLPQLIVKNTLKAFQSIAKNYRKTLTTNIIGITGSCGKTTAKELLALLLGNKDTFKTEGNFNNHLGLPYSITQIDPETHINAVLEVGISHPNEMDTLAKILQPNDAFLTNVAPVHLENFSSINSIAIEKFKLLNCAKNNIYYSAEFNHLNAQKNTSFIFTKIRNITSKNSIFYKKTPTNNGWKIEINDTLFEVPFLIGSGAIETFAMCIGIAMQKGIATQLLQQRLQQWKPFENRGVWKTINQRHYFIDCYNANPLSFTDSLQHFYKEAPKVKYMCFVLGSMLELGKRSYEYNQAIANNLHITVDDTFICIGKFKEAIAEGLIKCGAHHRQIHIFDTTEEAQALLSQENFNCIYLKGSHCYHLENLVAES